MSRWREHARGEWADGCTYKQRVADRRRLLIKLFLHPIANSHARLELILVTGEADALADTAAPRVRCGQERAWQSDAAQRSTGFFQGTRRRRGCGCGESSGPHPWI